MSIVFFHNFDAPACVLNTTNKKGTESQISILSSSTAQAVVYYYHIM